MSASRRWTRKSTSPWSSTCPLWKWDGCKKLKIWPFLLKKTLLVILLLHNNPKSQWFLTTSFDSLLIGLRFSWALLASTGIIWTWLQAMSRIQVCSTSLLILGPAATVTCSSHDRRQGCKRPSRTTLTFKASAHTTSTNIPLASVNLIAKSKVNGSGSIMYIREGVKNWEQ